MSIETHQIANHWRLRHHRLRLQGRLRESPDGSVQVSLNGGNWVEKTGNGYHRGENPLAGILIYQAPVEINAASD